MGGHGGSSGFISKAKQAKIKAEADAVSSKLAKGEISLGEAMKEKKAIANKYGIEGKTLTSIQYGDYASQVAELKKAVEAKKSQSAQGTSTAASVDASSFAGQNGNPWPPDASKNHLDYEGGASLGIWNQFGGGVKNGGVTSQQAKDMYSAVRDFTGSYSSAIRSAQQKGDTSSFYGKQGQEVENFIAAGIKSGNGWNGGATYRGIGGISDTALKNIQSMKAGDIIDCNLSAAASWSTNRSTSEGFGSSYNHVTFVHLGKSQKGVSVKKISSVGYENEVLVSKDAKYKVAAIVAGPVGSYNSQTYVYVEDAD